MRQEHCLPLSTALGKPLAIRLRTCLRGILDPNSCSCTTNSQLSFRGSNPITNTYMQSESSGAHLRLVAPYGKGCRIFMISKILDKPVNLKTKWGALGISPKNQACVLDPGKCIFVPVKTRNELGNQFAIGFVRSAGMRGQIPSEIMQIYIYIYGHPPPQDPP